jgi:hypothetical protein|mmetsp:Transcript_3486/g.7719  ORF Transcript_3486/g.7719 Transcript_3486/m.7719 type:complete len:83 (-) Transcript_3486:22-270(-)
MGPLFLSAEGDSRIPDDGEEDMLNEVDVIALMDRPNHKRQGRDARGEVYAATTTRDDFWSRLTVMQRARCKMNRFIGLCQSL